MRKLRQFIVSALVGGLLVLAPIYFALLLLLKAMQSLGGLVRPLAKLLPDWVPAENLLSLLLVLFVCFLVGAFVRTTAGRAIRERFEKRLFEKIHGYTLLRSMTQQLAGS